jgi:hypothetical protein
MSQTWPWVVLALLGAYHGLNPAMGWLFALALGLQERRRSAVVAALVPIALGHAAAITVAILLLRFAQHFFPASILKWGIAGILLALGIYRLFRASHPKGAGMRVGTRDLLIWSFLMSSAHGAGLMLMPVLMAHSNAGMSHRMTAALPVDAPVSSIDMIVFAVLVHTTAMLIIAAILAIVFYELYESVGLRLLRHAWVNFDLLWAIALIVAGIAVLVF